MNPFFIQFSLDLSNWCHSAMRFFIAPNKEK